MNILSNNFLLTWVSCCGGLLFLPIGDGFGGLGLKLMISCALACGAFNQQPISELSIALIALHFVFGILFSLPLVGAIFVVNWVGEIIDVGRGMTLSSIVDPSSEVPHSFSSFALQQGFLCYIATSGYFPKLFFTLVAPVRMDMSLQLIPSILEDVAIVAQPIVTSIAWLLIGILVTFILIEISFGLLGKVVPGVQISHESGVLKLVFLLIVSAALIKSPFESLIQGLSSSSSAYDAERTSGNSSKA